MSNKRKMGLTAREIKFCELYVHGNEEQVGNGSVCYKAAGYSPKTSTAAASAAGAVLARPKVMQYIGLLHRAVAAKTVNQIRNWKELAPDAQEVVIAISKGFRKLHGPNKDGDIDEQYVAIVDRDDAATASVQLKAAVEILERAYPKRVPVDLQFDDKEMLEYILGKKIPGLPHVIKKVN